MYEDSIQYSSYYNIPYFCLHPQTQNSLLPPITGFAYSNQMNPVNSIRKTCKLLFLTLKKIFILFVAALYIIVKNKCPTCKKRENIYVNTSRGSKEKAIAASCICRHCFILQEAEQTKSNNAQLGVWA